jgi:hypothetical protein
MALRGLGLPYALRYVAGDAMGSLVALEDAHVMRMAPVLRPSITWVGIQSRQSWICEARRHASSRWRGETRGAP